MSERKIEELEFKRYNSEIKVLRFKDDVEVFKMNPDGSFTVHENRITLSEGSEPSYSSFIRNGEFMDRSDRVMGPKVIVGSNEHCRVIIMADNLNDKQMFNIAKLEEITTAETLLNIKGITVDESVVELVEPAEAKAKESEPEEKPKPARTRRRKPAAKTKKETETETDSDV